MVLKRKVIRLAGGLVLLATLGFAALFGFGLYEKWGNPLLPKSRGPKPEAATAENTDQVKGIVASDDPVNPQESDGALTLRGEVLLPDGKPAAGATVSCWQTASGARESILTDDHGRFEIRDEFLRYPWLHVRTSEGALQAHCQLQAVGLRERVKAPLVITLQAARQHRVVVRANGQPVANAHLYVNQSAAESAKTNGEGVASLWIAANQKLHEVSCWHPELGIGGQSEWQRGGLDGDETVLDLIASTPCTLVVVDDQDRPIPDLTIGWNIRVKQPNQNYEWLHYSDVESLQIRTNAIGEAIVSWMPAGGVERINCQPIREGLYEMDEEVDLSTRRVSVKFRSKPKTRMLSGRVELPGGQNPAGLLVRGVAWDRSASARVRSDGTFSLPVIPGKLHGVDLVDVTWSATGWTGTPFATTDAAPPDIRLAAELGTRVNVLVTHGADHQPIPNVPVYFRGRHELRVTDEAGKEIQFYADPLGTSFYTDDHGEISVGVGPGELELSLRLDHWDETQAITVTSSSPPRVTFHRSWIGQRRIVGRVTLDDQPFEPSATTKVRGLAKLDSMEVEGTLDAKGAFDVAMNAADGNIVVIDPDRRLSGVATFDATYDAKLGSLLIAMRPMATFRSQLVDQHGKPFANQRLQLVMQSSQHPAASEVTTDANGEFQFDDVLTEVPLRITRINSAGDRLNKPGFDDERFFDAGEMRHEPKIVIALNEPTEVAALSKRPLDDRVASLVRDARLAHMHGLIVIEGDASPAVAQLKQRLLDYDELREVEAYGPLVISSESLPDATEYLDRQKWPKPHAGELALVALDDNGTSLEHITVKASDGDQAYQRAATLIRAHAPKPLDAIALIGKAREEAQQSDRNVLVVVGGARCGPCFVLSRWLDDQREMIAKDFVVVKFDGHRSLRAAEAVKQLAIRVRSIPFYAITDATGKVLITSEGPLGNIGASNSVEGIRHFRKMMEKSTRHMTPADIDELIQSIKERRE